RRKGGVGPAVAVAAVVAGTGVIGVLAGAGFAAFDGKHGIGENSVAMDVDGLAPGSGPAIKAEAGDHNGIQVPGAGGIDPAALATLLPSPSAAPTTAGATTDSATPTTTPTPSATATATPTATTRASATATTAKPSSTAKPANTPATGTAAEYAQQVADLVNAQRAQNGCGPVTVEARLTTAAQNHSEDMAARGYFDHASPEGHHADYRIEQAGYRWSAWGENIARGQKDPAAVMNAWMNSPGHRANILNCSFKQLGVGVRTGSGGPWWTQVFASPS
ncbi:CAP domain-containing protein, partial [Kitasatospora sp. NPDC004240]